MEAKDSQDLSFEEELDEIGFNIVLQKFTRRTTAVRLEPSDQMHREIAAAIVFDTSNRLLLQLRDNKPDILYPGRIGLFGGHREGQETFVECVVREIHEELSLFIPPDRFELIARQNGPDSESDGTVHAEFFVTRDVSVDQIVVTEGTLRIIELEILPSIVNELTPSALFALRALSLA